MNKNVGGIDQKLRIIAGLIVLSLFFVLDDPVRWWALIGLIPLGTGLAGWCPLYTVFGFRTCKTAAK